MTTFSNKTINLINTVLDTNIGFSPARYFNGPWFIDVKTWNKNRDKLAILERDGKLTVRFLTHDAGVAKDLNAAIAAQNPVFASELEIVDRTNDPTCKTPRTDYNITTRLDRSTEYLYTWLRDNLAEFYKFFTVQVR